MLAHLTPEEQLDLLAQQRHTRRRAAAAAAAAAAGRRRRLQCDAQRSNRPAGGRGRAARRRRGRRTTAPTAAALRRTAAPARGGRLAKVPREELVDKPAAHRAAAAAAVEHQLGGGVEEAALVGGRERRRQRAHVEARRRRAQRSEQRRHRKLRPALGRVGRGGGRAVGPQQRRLDAAGDRTLTRRSCRPKASQQQYTPPTRHEPAAISRRPPPASCERAARRWGRRRRGRRDVEADDVVEEADGRLVGRQLDRAADSLSPPSPSGARYAFCSGGRPARAVDTAQPRFARKAAPNSASGLSCRVGRPRKFAQSATREEERGRRAERRCWPAGAGPAAQASSARRLAQISARCPRFDWPSSALLDPRHRTATPSATRTSPGARARAPDLPARRSVHGQHGGDDHGARVPGPGRREVPLRDRRGAGARRRDAVEAACRLHVADVPARQEYTEPAVPLEVSMNGVTFTGSGCSTRTTTCASSPSRCSRRAAGRASAARSSPCTAPASATFRAASRACSSRASSASSAPTTW